MTLHRFFCDISTHFFFSVVSLYKVIFDNHKLSELVTETMNSMPLGLFPLYILQYDGILFVKRIQKVEFT